MWECAVENLNGGKGRHVRLRRGDAPASWRQVLNGWYKDEPFRTYFLGLLADTPFAAFRWETPAITNATVDQAFEFVMLDAPGLDRPPDPAAFAGQFRTKAGEASVVSFANLGGDAVLVVPRPEGPEAAYAHLAAFVRQAPERQRHELWRAVAVAMKGRLGGDPVWLSTAGAGVPWLHVRLDDRPKYYAHRPYAMV